VSAAEVTSYDSRCSATEESSAFRLLGRARLRPVCTPLGTTWSGDSDDVRHTAVPSQQHENELLQKTAEREETNEDSGTFDCTPPYTPVGRQNHTDRVANVSVHFPCSPATAELARRLRAAQRNNRRIATTNAISLTPCHSSPNSGDQVASFDVLPDNVVSRVFASGLDSCELCRCSLVCRRWNALVWNDSELWATIDFGCREALDVDNALRTVTRTLSRTTPRLCLGVEAVVLRNCHRLTDDGLRTVAKRCIDLRRLDVALCTLITNSAVFDVFSRCVNLQHLNITGIYLSSFHICFFIEYV